MRDKHESKLKSGEPAKPSGLSPRASREWDRLIGEMKHSGIQLAPAYRSLLEQASTLSADIAAAWEAIERDGRYLVSKSGAVRLHPAAADLSASRARLIFCLHQLCLTPRAQGAEANELPDDPMAKLLSRKS